MSNGSKVLATVAPAAQLHCNLRAEGFVALELRCGLFGADLELLSPSDCVWRSLARSGPVLSVMGQARAGLVLEVPLQELPPSTEHLVLATVGRTASEGGWLCLSVGSTSVMRSHAGKDSCAQGSMLLVLSRSPEAWLLQEMVPNLGLSLEQQAGAVVRELYWPEVGVAIQRTSMDFQSVTWLEVFRADPDGLCDSDEEKDMKESTETAETASNYVPPAMPCRSSLPEPPGGWDCQQTSRVLEDSAAGPASATQMWHPGLRDVSPSHSAACDEVDEVSLHGGQGRDFGPPRATQRLQEAKKNRHNDPFSLNLAEQQRQTVEAIAARRCLEQAHDENEALRRSWRAAEALAAEKSRRSEADVAELCQEAGRLTVSLGLAEEKHSKSEALAMQLRQDLSSLREEGKARERDLRQEAERLWSELEATSAKLTQHEAAWQTQMDDFATKLAKEKSKRERGKGELAALRQELERCKLAEQEAEASRKEGEKACAQECEHLRDQMRAEAEEAMRWRSEWAAARAHGSADPAFSAPTLRLELRKAEAAFAEELSSVRARLAAAERRNRELLENLQSTLQAGRQSSAPPAAVPTPPTSLPQEFRPLEAFQLGPKADEQDISTHGDAWQQWSRQRQYPEQDLWQLQEQQKAREVQLLRQQERQPLRMQPKERPIDATIAMSSNFSGGIGASYAEQDGGGSVSSTATIKPGGTGHGRHLTRLPSAPSFEIDAKNADNEAQIGEALRRAARQRRVAKTRSLDDEYARFVRDARRPASMPV
ncbi:SIK2 [Symbiodinium natans]|uniref:SIK2 protein n=1 Tax=Symbiodinium natans TaxID=878477 RepID=A0A812HXP8_9DINO|nr:SIK2 [Symbiodinium natans]